MRMAITEERLIATLRFLATGRSYEDLIFSTCVSAPSLSYIIPETCNEIFEALKKRLHEGKYPFININKIISYIYK